MYDQPSPGLFVGSSQTHAGPLDLCMNPDDAMLMYEFLSLLNVDINEHLCQKMSCS